MARKHDMSNPGDKAIDIDGEIKTFPNATDEEADANLAKIGLTEAQLDEAIAAAQAVVEKYSKNVLVSEFSVLETPEKCACGSRCVARTCEPYTISHPGGFQTTGHRLRCIRYACNPC